MTHDMVREFFLRRLRKASVSALALAAVALTPPCSADQVKEEMTAAVAAVRPALIRIHVVSTDYRQGRELKMESGGSGVIVSPEGFAITNHHVAMDAERIVCTLADKREVDAKLIGTDALADIAVIKLISPDGKPLPAARWGDSSKVEVGDRVYAMGSPYSLSQSVTMGIVSNTDMIMPEFLSRGDFLLDGEDVGSIVKWIGHDALIRPGNSGGPLVNADGSIIGINEISIGLAGAIPSNLAKSVADQLVRSGKVTRSWLGLEVQPVLDSSGLDHGVLVSGTLPDSPAREAGIKPGDVLLSIDGRKVSARFQEEVPLFNQLVAAIPVGKTVEAKILREGKEQPIKITTAERQKAVERQHELRGWGMCASIITYLMQKEMKLASQDGVIVTSVRPSGPAGSAKPALREDDVITRLGDEPVKDLAQLRTITKRLTEGQTEPVPVVVHFDRGQRRYVTVVKIGREEPSRPGAEISKAWLPINLQVLTRELAGALGVPGETGVRVTQLCSTNSENKPDLEVGDLILKLDGERIPADDIGDEEVLPSLIRQYDIGSEVTLAIIRDGKPMDVQVTLGTSPKPTRDLPKYEDEDFQFTVRDIAFSDRVDAEVDEDQDGVYVESVVDGSWVGLGGLCAGDVISRIDDAPISSLEELKEKMASITKKKPETVVFFVQRGIHTLFLEIKPEWPE